MGIFGKKKKDEPNDLIKSTILQTKFDENGALKGIIQVMANDGVNICAEACACCWDTKLPSKYEDRIEYIAKRTRIGHGSVTEHANHVYYMEISDEDMIDLAEFLSSYTEYVHTVYRHSHKWNKGYLIIGGSWRAFRDIILKSPAMHENSITTRLMSIIYQTMPSAGFADLIKMDDIEDHFDNIDGSTNCSVYAKTYNNKIGDNLEVISIDDLDILVENIKGVCPEPELFTKYDLLDMCTVTVLFKNMSRIITQQLTRHRNGITQESQRYVNYAGGSFNSPAMFKEKYDPNYQYSIQFGRSSHKMTLQELGDAMASIYGQLTDKDRTAGHDLQREDARAYLPNNIRCNKLYMTFTWRSFFSFLYLREEAHAQAEIRRYAQELGNWFRNLYPEYAEFEEVIDGYPGGGMIFYNPLRRIDGMTVTFAGVDEVLSEEEMVSQMEDYAQNSVEGEAYQPTNKVN